MKKSEKNESVVKLKYISDRTGKDFAYKLASDKIKKIGWKSNISINEGLNETIEWYTKNIHKLNKLNKNIFIKNNTMKKILITGGCGYIGTNLVDYLLSKSFSILVIDTQWFGT